MLDPANLINWLGKWFRKPTIGRQICTGTSNLKEAELILAKRIEEVRQAKLFGNRCKREFREAAAFYLETNMHLSCIGEFVRYLKQLDPFIGHLSLEQIHMRTLQPFIDARKESGVRNKTINLALSLVRRILNLSARLWRDENGLTWLSTSPLIQLLSLHDARKPYPLSWEEQKRLFQTLPDHLSRMCLYKVNTGCREQEVCQLRWDWEIQVPELETSVFLIPDHLVKNKEERLVVLNQTALSVINQVRGIHPEFVFTYKGKPVNSINNSSWKRVREVVGLKQVRVHDLKHTFGRRLRAAGVPIETRKVLLRHRNGDITTHYSAPELEELIEAANRVCSIKSGKSPSLFMLKNNYAGFKQISC